jgi:Holliday junction resolvasome RuvABC ATP-dependent DNA helicase subunit
MKTERKHDAIETADQQPRLTSAYFAKLVDICTDENGDIVFLIKEGDSLRVSAEYSLGGKIYVPPNKEDLPFDVPRAKEVLRWYGQDDDQLFEDLISYLKRFSQLPDPEWHIAACIIFLTYIQDHPDIHYIAVLLFWASPERGKSRSGKAIIYVSFRGIHLVDIRPANLFRYSEHFKATLFFDMKDFWKKVERSGTEDFFLNRFEKGAKVSRVLYPGKGPFRDTVHYNVFGPTIIATNEPVHHILDVRCIPISVPNKPGDYEYPIAEEAQELKERLTAWRAKTMGRPLPRVEPIQGLNGRLLDITRPILQVCKLVCPDKLGVVTEAILEKARQRLDDNRETIEGEIVSALYKLSPKVVTEFSISVEKILHEVNEKRAKGQKLTSQSLGRRIKALGLKTRKIHGYAEVVLNRESFNAFLVQFGVLDPSIPPETLPLSTTIDNQLISKNFSGRESRGEKASFPSSHVGSAILNRNGNTSGVAGKGSEVGVAAIKYQTRIAHCDEGKAIPLLTFRETRLIPFLHSKESKTSPFHPAPPTESTRRPEGPLPKKYRPRTWDEIWGNEEVVEGLRSVFSKPPERRPHVFLLVGRSGCGKTTIARIINKELGCSDVEYSEINAADKRGIDCIRDIILDCGFLPLFGEVKLFVLDEVHELTTEAQNALLKVLEDTPEHVYFVLCTTEPGKIIETIKTRCTTYHVNPLQPSIIRDRLDWVCKEERKKVQDELLESISKVCNGSPRLALVLLDQIKDIDDAKLALKIVTHSTFRTYKIR